MDRANYPLLGALDKGVCILSGFFGIDTSGGVSSTSGGVTHFNGGDLVHTTTGVYTLTLNAKYASILYANATLGKHTAADIEAEIGDISGIAGVTAAQPPTIVVRTVKSSDKTAVDNSTEARTLFVEVHAKNSIVER